MIYFLPTNMGDLNLFLGIFPMAKSAQMSKQGSARALLNRKRQMEIAKLTNKNKGSSSTNSSGDTIAIIDKPATLPPSSHQHHCRARDTYDGSIYPSDGAMIYTSRGEPSWNSGDILAGQLTQAGAGVGQLNKTVGSDTLTIREVGEQNYLSKDMAGNVLRETNNNEVKDSEEKQDEKVGENFYLYLGLGLLCIGFIITCVGLGEKGFHTIQLKLVGPILVVLGAFFAILRILMCIYPANFLCCRAVFATQIHPDNANISDKLHTEVNNAPSVQVDFVENIKTDTPVPARSPNTLKLSTISSPHSFPYGTDTKTNKYLNIPIATNSIDINPSIANTSNALPTSKSLSPSNLKLSDAALSSRLLANKDLLGDKSYIICKENSEYNCSKPPDIQSQPGFSRVNGQKSARNKCDASDSRNEEIFSPSHPSLNAQNITKPMLLPAQSTKLPDVQTIDKSNLDSSSRHLKDKRDSPVDTKFCEVVMVLPSQANGNNALENVNNNNKDENHSK